MILAGLLLAAAAPGAPVYDALTLQASRATLVKESMSRRYYGADEFDLSDLPTYTPERQVSGVIRFWGSDLFGGPGLKTQLEADFRRAQPGVSFADNLKVPGLAIAGLLAQTADLGVGRRMTWADQLSFERIYGYAPLVIHGMTGWAVNPPFTIVVNAKNPLRHLTVAQLDGIFGAQRTGGWVGTTWHPEFARGAEGNIRSWGQLGLSGEWRDRPIQPHVYALRCMFGPRFADDVLRGSDQWNERVRQYFNISSPEGRLISMDQQMADALAADPGGISFLSGLRGANPGIRTLAIGRSAEGPFVLPDARATREHRYPLTDWMYFFVNRAPGTPIAPPVREFLRFLLSRDGQAAVVADGKLLPLTADQLRRERARLDE